MPIEISNLSHQPSFRQPSGVSRTSSAAGSPLDLLGMGENLTKSLSAGANYLEKSTLDSLTADLETAVRRNPVLALGIGVGIGLMLARFLKSQS
jgi:hypothetical protein